MTRWTEYTVYKYPTEYGMAVGVEREPYPARRAQWLTCVVKGGRPKILFVRMVDSGSFNGSTNMRSTAARFRRI
jgi:hypothetical protein